MDTFDFPFHTVVVRYPDDQKRIKLGFGYTFAVQPFGPIERNFLLTLTGMQWFFDTEGVIDRTATPQRNIAFLIDFYETQRLNGEFLYTPPGFAECVVTFAGPLEILAALPGGMGVLPDLAVQLVEHPS
jgi:hypothetical protein